MPKISRCMTHGQMLSMQVQSGAEIQLSSMEGSVAIVLHDKARHKLAIAYCGPFTHHDQLGKLKEFIDSHATDKRVRVYSIEHTKFRMMATDELVDLVQALYILEGSNLIAAGPAPWVMVDEDTVSVDESTRTKPSSAINPNQSGDEPGIERLGDGFKYERYFGRQRKLLPANKSQRYRLYECGPDRVWACDLVRSGIFISLRPGFITLVFTHSALGVSYVFQAAKNYFAETLIGKEPLSPPMRNLLDVFASEDLAQPGIVSIYSDRPGLDLLNTSSRARAEQFAASYKKAVKVFLRSRRLTEGNEPLPAQIESLVEHSDKQESDYLVIGVKKEPWICSKADLLKLMHSPSPCDLILSKDGAYDEHEIYSTQIDDAEET